ncbi:hypothetical protein W97_06501 [Coniosporium apollinis CBS 100218]|uniref:Uncharacterized protein n=1 Tax=Coniosporium apollinis (strain CBS 100218) TaxID=1168221 RepID=R7YZI8_CONA1|nr:uncharacterized protein W97_06501 [Coniosporium apollinis CBS 100218]EON67248.1 hypothetical protein W97_06501 [Coniosporium apollinis CBS 100218]
MTDNATAFDRQQDGYKSISKHANKWRGKLFAKDEALAKEKEASKLKLKVETDQDVSDFLKPSTEKHKVLPPKPPRIDAAAASRWPGAADVLKLAGTQQILPSAMGGKSGKRGHLVVTFARTPPEIIGLGGDESEEPAIEVSKRRSGVHRKPVDQHLQEGHGSAVSLGSQQPPLNGMPQSGFNEPQPTVARDRRPAAFPRQPTAFPQPLRNSSADDNGASPTALDNREPDFIPPPVKRAPTSFHGEDDGVSRPSIDTEDHRSPVDTQPPELPQRPSAAPEPPPPLPPKLPLRLPEMELAAGGSPIDFLGNDFLKSDPTDPSSFPAKVLHQMRADEGNALHEAARTAAYVNLAESPRPSTSNSSSSFAMAPSSSQPSTLNRPSFDAPSPHRKPLPSAPSHNNQYLDLSYEPRPSIGHTEPIPIRSWGQRSPQQPSPSPQDRSADRTPSSYTGSLQSKPSPLPQSLTAARPPPPGAPQPPPHSSPLPPPSPQLPLASPGYFGYLPPSPFGEKPARLPGFAQEQGTGLHAATPSVSSSIARNANDEAFDDFSERVTHMKGIFRLTAEIERPLFEQTPMQWLRASIWWFLRGRAGMEILIRNRPRGQDGRPVSSSREQLLAQPHVDLAKNWWIVTELLPMHPSTANYAGVPIASQASAARNNGDNALTAVFEARDIILANLKALLASMSRNQVMPPYQSLIQGQDQSIWIKYPSFAPDVQAILSGNATKSLTVGSTTRNINPVACMPLADTKTDFCYGRLFVQASIATEDQDSDRVSLPCVLSILRGRNDWTLKVSICSQTTLVNVLVQGSREAGPTWDDVQWKTKTRGMYVRLPRGFTLSVDFSEKDFRQLQGIEEYTRKVEASLLPLGDEKVVHEVTLRDFQYSDSSNPQALPAERIPRCHVRIFEKSEMLTEGTGQRRMHRGYRFHVVTSPKLKTLSYITHELGRDQRPIGFEFRSSPSSDGASAPAMVLRFKEETRQCNVFLTFNNPNERNQLYAVLNGMNLTPDETVFAQVPLKSLSIEPADQAEGFNQSGHDALRTFTWQDLKVINHDADDTSGDFARTVLSEQLRIVAHHSAGSLTDRLNLSPGELQLRLPTSGNPELSILRAPQADLTMSVDHQRVEKSIPDTLAALLTTILTGPTIRTFTFHDPRDLHAFQTAITGFDVKYDGVAASYAIARRRMVVPIYKKWEATAVRVQIVKQDSVTQLLAFMEGFAQADAMGFQLRPMDVFEKGEGRGRWWVRLVDAKFALPNPKERRREDGYVCLDQVVYPGEHDDVTVGFESEAERDRFAEALPAATQTVRAVTFKRKI